MKRFILGMMIALLLAVPALAAAQTEDLVCNVFTDSADDIRTSYYMGEGAAFYNTGQLRRATDSFSCIVEQIDQQYVPGFLSRAAVYAARGDYDLALTDLDRSIELDSSEVGAYNNRGVVFAALRDYDEAAADFDRALDLDAEFTLALSNRGVIRALQGDFPGAIADMEGAISRSNIDDALAELTREDREFDDPLPTYERSDAQPYALLGMIYSAYALDNYRAYLTLTGSDGDRRIQSAAGALESRFNFELRLDDTSWLLVADFIPGD